jgi:hypothetical protein
MNTGKAAKAESKVGATGYLPKQDKWQIPEPISGTEGSIQNGSVPPCWVRS